MRIKEISEQDRRETWKPVKENGLTSFDDQVITNRVETNAN